MKKVTSDIVIIGAGLTGLALAYYLKDQNLSVSIVEARDRIGGRIHTRYGDEVASTELGATWLGTKHDALTRLLEQHLTITVQTMSLIKCRLVKMFQALLGYQLP